MYLCIDKFVVNLCATLTVTVYLSAIWNNGFQTKKPASALIFLSLDSSNSRSTVVALHTIPNHRTGTRDSLSFAYTVEPGYLELYSPVPRIAYLNIAKNRVQLEYYRGLLEVPMLFTWTTDSEVCGNLSSGSDILASVTNCALFIRRRRATQMYRTPRSHLVHQHSYIIMNRDDLSKTNKRVGDEHCSALKKIGRFIANAAAINNKNENTFFF